MKLKQLLVSTCVAVGLYGSLLGVATAQDTSPIDWRLLGFGPGVAGQVTIGPFTPVCRPNIPCNRPFAGASVQVISLNDDLKEVVGLAVTNALGNFVVSVPAGDYLLLIDAELPPHCEEVKISVAKTGFSFATVNCDSGIR